VFGPLSSLRLRRLGAPALKSRAIAPALLVAIGFVWVTPSPALADPSPMPQTSSPAVADVGSITIGDSVMLGAKWALLKGGISIVDAKVSRQALTGPGLIRKRGSKLPGDVVVHLGTNGTYTPEVCRAIIKAAGPSRHVFLLTLKVPRSWEHKNNVMIRKCAADNSEHASVIDWHWAAGQHPEWLYSDGMHLRPAGAKGYARMIDWALNAPR
jgi:hypothetical protein